MRGLHVKAEANTAEYLDDDDAESTPEQPGTELVGRVVKQQDDAEYKGHKQDAHGGTTTKPVNNQPTAMSTDVDGVKKEIQCQPGQKQACAANEIFASTFRSTRFHDFKAIGLSLRRQAHKKEGSGEPLPSKECVLNYPVRLRTGYARQGGRW